MTAVATDSIVFAVPDDLTSDMVCEVKQREEARKWEALKPCPCCGAPAEERQRDPSRFTVACSTKLCKIASGKTAEEARWVWNHEGRFTD